MRPLSSLLVTAIPALLVAAAAPAGAQTTPAAPATPPSAAGGQTSDGTPPQRVESVVVYGSDPCPAGNGGTIVVCARRPESERYRIPKRFRGQARKASPASNAWANKVETTEGASRTAAGLPNTCSPVGSGGQTGCFQQMQAQAAAQRRAAKQQQQEIDNPSEP